MAVEHDEYLFLGRVAVRRSPLLVRGQRDTVQTASPGAASDRRAATARRDRESLADGASTSRGDYGTLGERLRRRLGTRIALAARPRLRLDHKLAQLCEQHPRIGA